MINTCTSGHPDFFILNSICMHRSGSIPKSVPRRDLIPIVNACVHTQCTVQPRNKKLGWVGIARRHMCVDCRGNCHSHGRLVLRCPTNPKISRGSKDTQLSRKNVQGPGKGILHYIRRQDATATRRHETTCAQCANSTRATLYAMLMELTRPQLKQYCHAEPDVRG